MKKKKTYWAVCAALLITGATACGGDSDDGAAKNPPVQSPSEICDGTLGGTGASALQKIGDMDEYWELEGSDQFGNPFAFSLKAAAKELREKGTSESRCGIYLADSDVDAPLITIEFDTLPASTDLSKAGKDEAGSDRVFYSLGAYASTAKGYAATLYFACPAVKDGGFVTADMFINAGLINPSSTAKDQMTVLNAISHSLSEELGCAAEAKLPAEVPEGHKVSQ